MQENPPEPKRPVSPEKVEQSPALKSESLAEQERAQLVNKKLEQGIRLQQAEGRVGANLTRALTAGVFSFNLGVSYIFDEGIKTPQSFAPEQVQVIEGVTGMSFAELEKKFDIKLTVQPDARGKYIIHIGQTHEDPNGGLIRDLTIGKVITAQMKMEDVVQNIVQRNTLSCIFSEGLADEKILLSYRDYILDGEKKIDELLASPITSVRELSKAELVLSQYSSTLGVSFVNNYLSPRVNALGKKLEDVVASGTVSPQDEMESQMMRFVTSDLTTSSIMRTMSNFGGTEPDPYASGVAFKQLMEHKVQFLCPSEDSDLNAKAIASLKERDRVRGVRIDTQLAILKEMANNPEYSRADSTLRALSKKNSKDLTAEEQQQYKQAYDVVMAVEVMANNDTRVVETKEALDSAEAEFDRLALVERNNEVLRKIDLYDQRTLAQGGGLDNVLVIFGSDHDFTQALTAWNNANPADSIDRGLLKLTPKE